MNAHPQTIQIFLPSGDPQGIRTASITTRIVQVVEIPRLRLEEFLERPEASSVGIYIRRPHLFHPRCTVQSPKPCGHRPTGPFSQRLDEVERQHREDLRRGYGSLYAR